MLDDPELDAVVIATPVPTHFELAKQALEAGKHVFVEKPPAMTGAEIDELVAIAEERDLVLMPGHLLLYHPGVQKLKELVDVGSSRRRALRVRQPAEPRPHPPVRERPLVARRARPLGDPLPARRGSRGGDGARARLPPAGCRGRRLLLPALPVGPHRAHAPLVARPAQDAEDDRGRHGEDGRLRRHGARPQGHGLREVAVEARQHATASGRRERATSTSRRSPPTSRSGSSAASSSVSSRARATAGRSRRTAPASFARSTCSRSR